MLDLAGIFRRHDCGALRYRDAGDKVGSQWTPTPLVRFWAWMGDVRCSAPAPALAAVSLAPEPSRRYRMAKYLQFTFHPQLAASLSDSTVESSPIDMIKGRSEHMAAGSCPTAPIWPFLPSLDLRR